jgi:hypothetical protein
MRPLEGRRHTFVVSTVNTRAYRANRVGGGMGCPKQLRQKTNSSIPPETFRPTPVM